MITVRHFIVLLCACLSAWGTAAVGQDAFALSEDCPPGFELTSGHCELRSLYLMYPSLEGAGVGGLKTGLPVYRDGFSPQQIDLGRYLFFDPVLSADASVSCASCHNPDLGFSDGRGRSVGIAGDPLALSLLVGMGVTGLSMNPVRIPDICKLVEKIDSQLVRHLVGTVLGSNSTAAVRRKLQSFKNALDSR